MGYVFNPPPGWPPPPPGWVMPPGWAPDPSWPPAPSDWQWWLPASDAVAPPAPTAIAVVDGRRAEVAAAPPATVPSVPAAVSPAPVVAVNHHESWGERRAQRKEAKEHAEATAAWQAEQDMLDRAVALAEALSRGSAVNAGLVLKAGERAAWTGTADLIEPRRGPGHYRGASQGVSFRIAKGVRYRVGGTRGTFIPGDEVQTVVDHGSATVTTQRVVFVGGKATREWSFAKLIEHETSRDHRLNLIHVSNRQKVSGLQTKDGQLAEALTLCLLLAQASATDVLEGIRSQAEEHRAQRP